MFDGQTKSTGHRKIGWGQRGWRISKRWKAVRPYPRGQRLTCCGRCTIFRQIFCTIFLCFFPTVDGDYRLCTFLIFLEIAHSDGIDAKFAGNLSVDHGWHCWYDPDVRREGRNKGAFLDPNNLCLAAMIQSLATYFFKKKHFFLQVCRSIIKTPLWVYLYTCEIMWALIYKYL